MANPKVRIRPVRRPHGISTWVVWCETGDCEYVEVDPAKTYAQEMQRRHARSHRAEQARSGGGS
jgi:hypothetical protein